MDVLLYRSVISTQNRYYFLKMEELDGEDVIVPTFQVLDYWYYTIYQHQINRMDTILNIIAYAQCPIINYPLNRMEDALLPHWQSDLPTISSERRIRSNSQVIINISSMDWSFNSYENRYYLFISTTLEMAVEWTIRTSFQWNNSARYSFMDGNIDNDS